MKNLVSATTGVLNIDIDMDTDIDADVNVDEDIDIGVIRHISSFEYFVNLRISGAAKASTNSSNTDKCCLAFLLSLVKRPTLGAHSYKCC